MSDQKPPEPQSPPSGPSEQPSEAFARDLRVLYRREVEVPPEVDAAVLREAARRLRGPRGGTLYLRRWRWAVSVAAAAAVLVLGVWIADPWRVREDLDGSGRVDILDAFLLARRLESGAALDTRWDVNRDGRVDQGDVDWVANRAVRIR